MGYCRECHGVQAPQGPYFCKCGSVSNTELDLATDFYYYGMSKLRKGTNMSEADFLLTDEFAAFSQKIADIHGKKKARTEEFKVIYDAYKADVAALEAEAKTAADEWEAWKSEHTK